MTSQLPFAGVLYLEQRWWGWHVRATVGPYTTTKRVPASTKKRAMRIGSQQIALLLEVQRRAARANGGAS